MPNYDIILTTGSTQYVESSGLTSSFKPIYLKPIPTTTTTSTTIAQQTVKYGYLYNQYAYENVLGIANTGWHVPTSTEYSTLDSYISNNAFGLISTGTTYWNGNGGTNIYNFNGRGSGIRYGYGMGTFDDLKNYIYLATTTLYSSGNNVVWAIYGGASPSNDFFNDYWSFESGVAVRLIKDSTSLSNGQSGTYTGNDGKIYPTICIGTQEWLATNLAETKYNDDSNIPEVTNNTTWHGLSTGARCSYNNNESNAFI